MTYHNISKCKLLTIALAFSNFAQAAGDQSAISSVLATVLHRYVDQLKSANNVKHDIAESPETRGGGGGYGGGHGGGGGHGHGYGAITLDPVSIISLLALGAFLINNILQLLRANQAPAPAPAPGRSFSDGHIFPDDKESIISSPTDDLNDKYSKSSKQKEPSFSQFFENVGSLYYLQPKKRNICIKKVVCRYVNEQQKSREDGQGTFKIRVFDFMLSAITRFVAPELSAESVRDDACGRFNKLCSDSLLADAKTSVENKVYAEVSSLISNLAVKQLVG